MKTSRLFWGILIVVAGLVMLLANMGLLPTGFWPVFFAAALIIVGGWFLVSPYIARHEYSGKTETIQIPLEGAAEAKIKLSHGAGKISLKESNDDSVLASGTFVNGVETNLERESGLARLRIKAPSDAWVGFPPASVPGFEGLRWDVELNRSIPIRLKLETGASEVNMDLSQLNVKELKVETGASSTRVILPAKAGYTRVDVDCGAASFDITVPEGVACRVQIKSGLAGIQVDQNRFPMTDGFYESPDYGTAANRAEITIDTGLGSVQVH